LPIGATVEYADVIPREEAIRRFPEVDPSRIVHVDHLVDLDSTGLSGFATGSFDFVVLSHVLEHLSNPIKAIEEAFRIIRAGGLALVAIPDMRFTFDKHRELTPFEHLEEDYRTGCTQSSDDHYVSFLKSAHPWVVSEDWKNIGEHVARARARREHTHVWDSDSFRSFMAASLALVAQRAEALYESPGDENRFEYFSIWQKA